MTAGESLGDKEENGSMRNQVKIAEGILVGCGNPLLDIETNITKEFLEKWNLKENDAILCDDQHAPMFTELIENFDVKYVPGGSTQNTLRVCQWILNEANRTVFFGSIANDEYGETLRKKALEAGVHVRYQTNQANDIKTGTCAALIYNHQRSLCAHLSAANTFTVDHLCLKENESFIEGAQYFYIAGFFLTVCPPAIMKIAKHAAEHNKVFMMNLAAPFIPKFFSEPLQEALPYVDVVFGNEGEAKAFAEANRFENAQDIKEIAYRIATSSDKKNVNRLRTVIITQGSDPTIVVSGDSICEYPVKKLNNEEIVDTNGAGDAFAGGFISQFIQGKSIEDAVHCGHYAAMSIIKQHGCTIPVNCDYH